MLNLSMKLPGGTLSELRQYRNSKLYRPLGRIWRIYNKRLVAALHARGFEDFSPAFPQIMSNLDTQGTRIGVLATRAGVTRQAAGQLVAEIERCGYVERRAASDDSRATIVRFTPRGRRLLATVLGLVEEMEASFAALVDAREFETVRATLARLADALDPEGAFGPADE
jgi:DNA-binding MarR family transcriptional regulator